MGKKKQAMSLAHDDVIVGENIVKRPTDDRQDETFTDGWKLKESYGDQVDVDHKEVMEKSDGKLLIKDVSLGWNNA